MADFTNRSHDIVCICEVPYDFEKDGERLSGTTLKVCFREFTDGLLSGLYIAKAVIGFSANLGQRGILAFDRFGKITTFTPL